MADGRCDEVTRDDFSPLVNQLIERVLTVSARFAPDDRASLVIHRVAVTVNELTVRFHVALLEVSGKTVHVLVVWQDSFGFSAIEIVVPDADQRQQYRQVFLSRRIREVFIHRVSTAQQLFEVIETYRQRDRQTDG